METPNRSLIAKTRGMIDALGKLPAKELAGRPNVAFAKDYNRLRLMFVEAHPDHAAFAPSEAEVVEDSLIPGVNATYVEILAYCEQLMNLLRNLEIDRDR
jgi:hypothetical protein